MKTVEKNVVATVYMCDKCGREFALKNICRRHEDSCQPVPPEPLYKIGEWVSVKENRVMCIIGVNYDASCHVYRYDIRPLGFEKGGVAEAPDYEEFVWEVVEQEIEGVLNKDQVNSAASILEGIKTHQGDGRLPEVLPEEVGLLGGCTSCRGVVIGIEYYIPLDVEKRERVPRS